MTGILLMHSFYPGLKKKLILSNVPLLAHFLSCILAQNITDITKMFQEISSIPAPWEMLS